MSRWNNEVGENLLLKNNKSGWNKQGASTFSSNQRHGLGGMFPLEYFPQSVLSSES